MMKKILLIAYHFPPSDAVGGLRIAKFARNLPLFGWEPIVLTVEDRYREKLDQERLGDLGDTRIIKTAQLPKFTDMLLSLKRMAYSLLYRGKKPERIESEDQYGENFDEMRSETLMQRLKRYYISFSSIPDSERCWVFPAAIQAIMEIRAAKIECVMTSSPPHSAHLIGFIASKLTGTRWVADFRDPWIDILSCRTPLIRSAWSDSIERWLESLVIRNADRIITTTDEHRKAIISRYPDQPASKFIYIPNGIDSDKFNNRTAPERYAVFTLAYAGTIYLKRSPEPIFKAMQKLISSGRIRPDEIKFKLFGHCGLIDGKPIEPIIRGFGLETAVEVKGPIPFSEAINVIQRSHLAVLLSTPVQSINIPAKIYDYFGSGTKILAITEPGAVSTMIKNTNSGKCFCPADIDGIAAYIYENLIIPGRDNNRTDPSHYAQFDSKLLTAELSRQITMLTSA